MRSTIVAACVALAMRAPAHADDLLVGKSVVTGDAGAPFCTDRDQLQEYVLAAVEKDEKWLSSLDTCGTFKGGVKVAIIEEYPGSELGHVVNARVFGNGGSGVGYMLSIGLDAK